MTTPAPRIATIDSFDAATEQLVRLAAVLAGGTEAQVRTELQQSLGRVEVAWVEELILQTYLFAGFPRTLNAAREWRRLSGIEAPVADEGLDGATEFWTLRGEATCSLVYGPFYDKLRHNIRNLHPSLDEWMIVEGYGKVLGRPQLDLGRRELCVVAACAIGRQDRQLHSHLHGALHAGVPAHVVSAALSSISDLLHSDDAERFAALWSRVQGK